MNTSYTQSRQYLLCEHIAKAKILNRFWWFNFSFNRVTHLPYTTQNLRSSQTLQHLKGDCPISGPCGQRRGKKTADEVWGLPSNIFFFCKRQKPDVNKEHKNLNPVKSTFGLNNVLVGRLPLIYWYFPLNERLTKQSSWVGLIHLEKSIPQQHDKLLTIPVKKKAVTYRCPPECIDMSQRMNHLQHVRWIASRWLSLL